MLGAFAASAKHQFVRVFDSEEECISSACRAPTGERRSLLSAIWFEPIGLRINSIVVEP
jgi:hypothetical protein